MGVEPRGWQKEDVSTERDREERVASEPGKHRELTVFGSEERTLLSEPQHIRGRQALTWASILSWEAPWGHDGGPWRSGGGFRNNCSETTKKEESESSTGIWRGNNKYAYNSIHPYVCVYVHTYVDQIKSAVMQTFDPAEEKK